MIRRQRFGRHRSGYDVISHTVLPTPESLGLDLPGEAAKQIDRALSLRVCRYRRDQKNKFFG